MIILFHVHGPSIPSNQYYTNVCMCSKNFPYIRQMSLPKGMLPRGSYGGGGRWMHGLGTIKATCTSGATHMILLVLVDDRFWHDWYVSLFCIELHVCRSLILLAGKQ